MNMVKKDKVISINYKVKNDQGQELDSSQPDAPLEYLHGAAQILPKLEEQLEGLDKGDQKQVELEPKDAYGEVDPKLQMDVKKSVFPEGTDVQEGMQFAAQDDDGGQIVFTVTNVDGDKVSINGNHPLAGQKLHFDVEVVDFRDPTKEELEQNQGS